jgi:hypothetical protein
MIDARPAPSFPPDGSPDPVEARTRARVDVLDALTALALRAAGALTARLEAECELGKPVVETMAALKDAGRMARQTTALADKLDRTSQEAFRKRAEAAEARRAEARRKVLDRKTAVGMAVAHSIFTAADGDEETAERLFDAFDAYEKLEDPADYWTMPTGRIAGRICTALGIDTITTEIDLDTLLADEAAFGPYGPAVTTPPVAYVEPACPRCAAAQATASPTDSS